MPHDAGLSLDEVSTIGSSFFSLRGEVSEKTCLRVRRLLAEKNLNPAQNFFVFQLESGVYSGW